MDEPVADEPFESDTAALHLALHQNVNLPIGSGPKMTKPCLKKSKSSKDANGQNANLGINLGQQKKERVVPGS